MPSKSSNIRVFSRLILLMLLTSGAIAQEPASPESRATAALESVEPASSVPALPLVQLMLSGGWLMIPIAILSLVVIAIAIERTLALRTRRLAPRPLARGLAQMAESSNLDPKAAYALCERYPSVLGRVTQAALVKTGRPLPELEAAMESAAQTEADALHGGVRTLNLAASVAPLLGLLGTVWGMIQCFFTTANLPEGANRAQSLAGGIYVALVTTLAGLVVAIPAATLAHYFEGKILRRLDMIQRLGRDLLPRLEPFEGQGRLDRRELEQPTRN